ncbi:unnamed protein product [Cochlearia groenlandica]
MKRDRSDYEETIKQIDIVKSLMMLSRSFVVNQIDVKQYTGNKTDVNQFECKTCNKRFDSFQALGGHRASHKKPKLTFDQEQAKHRNNNENDHTHKCSFCDQMFGTGQALGGHMRKHRTEQSVISSSVYTRPVLNRCSSSKRILCLDLNLTPLENDLVSIFGSTN